MFVKAIEKVVLDSTVKGIQETLDHPPGRAPSKDLLELSQWYTSLTDKDKQMITKVITKASANAVFGFFCVIDGVRVFEDGPEKGDLELYYKKKNSETVLLNSPSGNFLHELMDRY